MHFIIKKLSVMTIITGTCFGASSSSSKNNVQTPPPSPAIAIFKPCPINQDTHSEGSPTYTITSCPSIESWALKAALGITMKSEVSTDV